MMAERGICRAGVSVFPQITGAFSTGSGVLFQTVNLAPMCYGAAPIRAPFSGPKTEEKTGMRLRGSASIHRAIDGFRAAVV
jgi:hypothetical protein